MAEPGPDGEDHVGGGQRLAAGAPIGQHAQKGRLALADHASPGDGRDDGRPQAPDDGAQLLLGAGGHHAAAGDDQRVAGLREETRGLLHVADVARRPRAVAARRSRPVHARGQEVVGNREDHGARSAGAQQIERARDGGGNRARLGQRLRPAGDRAEALDLVRHLVQGAEIAPDQVRGDVGGDQHDRHRAGVRLHQGREGVGRAGPGGDEHHAGLAGGAGVAVGHERRARLVAREHVGDVALAQQRVVDGQVVIAGNAEDVSHALGGQRLHHPVAAGRRRHEALASAYSRPPRRRAPRPLRSS